MEEPLGYAVGNSLEMKEALEVLSGTGMPDITEVCLSLACEMASLALDIDIDEARGRVEKSIKDGSAKAKLKEWISAQGGDVTLIDNPDRFYLSPMRREVEAEDGGYISSLNAEKIGTASVALGAGRNSKEDEIDLGAGIVILKKVGERVEKGDPVAIIYSDSEEKLDEGEKLYLGAVSYSQTKPQKDALIYKIIRQ